MEETNQELIEKEKPNRRSVGKVCLDTILGAGMGGAFGGVLMGALICISARALYSGTTEQCQEAVKSTYYLMGGGVVGAGFLGAVAGALRCLPGYHNSSDTHLFF